MRHAVLEVEHRGLSGCVGRAVEPLVEEAEREVHPDPEHGEHGNQHEGGVPGASAFRGASAGEQHLEADEAGDGQQWDPVAEVRARQRR